MTKLVFLVEEPSMANLLDELLPRLFPNLSFQCVPHRGKADLEKSIPKKLRAWREPGVRFMVMRDQDSGDCRTIKAKLATLCEQSGRADTFIRVVCRELEAWYIGDAEALTQAFPATARQIRRELRKSRFRDPDSVDQPAKALSGFIPKFQKRSGARSLGRHLSRQNRSCSYQVFPAGVERLLSENAPKACA